MFSIIIPTLLKSEEILNKLLAELASDDSVGEILVIDNSLKGFSNVSSKVRVLIPNENLFVNPSWNFGIKEAKYEYFGILNDDLLLPENLCTETLKFLKETETTGLVGLDPKAVKGVGINEFNTYPPNKKITFEPVEYKVQMGYWGSAFFGKKSHYSPIPEDMKIWCGDNYLLKMNVDAGRQNYKFCGITVKHYGSLSAGSTKLDDIKKSDVEIYSKIDPQFKNHDMGFHKLTMPERIFSLRNSRDRRHKILTVLGIKMSFRKRNRI